MDDSCNKNASMSWLALEIVGYIESRTQFTKLSFSQIQEVISRQFYHPYLRKNKKLPL